MLFVDKQSLLTSHLDAVASHDMHKKSAGGALPKRFKNLIVSIYTALQVLVVDFVNVLCLHCVLPHEEFFGIVALILGIFDSWIGFFE